MPLLEQIQAPIGASGTDSFNGEVWSPDEYNVDLSSPTQAVMTYDRMRKSDGRIRSCINRLFYALLAAQWRVDPVDEDDPEEVEIAEFVKSVLMPGETYGYSGMSTWYRTLRQSLLMTVHGFAVLEKVWAWRPRDGKQVIASFEGRLARTVQHFDIAQSGPEKLEAVTQWTQQKGTKKIPSKNLVVLSFNREGENYWGESILRPAHTHWRYKRSLLGFDAIVKERQGGVFWVTVKEGMTATDSQILEAKRVLQNFRVHEKQGLYFPSCFEFHAVFPSGEGSKMLNSISLHNQEIEASMLSEWQSLGTGEKGSRSVGEIQLDFMLYAYQSHAKQIEDEFGSQAIVELVDTNFGEREKYPRLACENFLAMKPDRLAEVLQPLVSSGVVRIDKPLRVYFRQRFALPDEDEETLEPAPGQMLLGPGGQPQQGGPANRPARGDQDDAEKLRKAYARLRYARLRRAPLEHESHVEAEQLKAYLDQEAEYVWRYVVAPIRGAQIDALAAKAASLAVSDDRNPLDVAALGAPKQAELAREMGQALRAAYDRGRRTILAERRRQVAAKADEDDDEDLEVSRDQRNWIAELAASFSSLVGASLATEAVRAATTARQAEMTRAQAERAVRAALERLSPDRAASEVGGAVARAFTTGRVDQILAMSNQVETVYYSAIMDSGTCEACAAMDGRELDLDEVASSCPNPDCAWPPNCRCIPISTFTQQREAA